jgi:hypothetical protein
MLGCDLRYNSCGDEKGQLCLEGRLAGHTYEREIGKGKKATPPKFTVPTEAPLDGDRHLHI